jgi:AcrR family transcriptional regulator
MSAPVATSLRELAARYSPAQLRTIDTALDLFARNGVGGTSLQMIADALGVTKAAIYHQFQTKEAIVLATIEVKLVPIEAALADADRAGRTEAAREQLLERVIETVVGNRQVTALQNDPVLAALLGAHEPSRHLWAELYAVLLGHELDVEARVRAAVLASAIGSVANPFVRDIDDARLRDELVRLTRPLLGR